MTSLSTTELRLAYDRTVVVDGVDLVLPDGRLTAVVGPNGCGKSTLLAGLSRLHAPAAGAVLLDGRELASLSPREREVLNIVATGVSNSAIAERLRLAPKTVGNHMSAIFLKLGVASRSEAIVIAKDAGLGLHR